MIFKETFPWDIGVSPILDNRGNNFVEPWGGAGGWNLASGNSLLNIKILAAPPPLIGALQKNCINKPCVAGALLQTAF